jgi:hypothetical protein
VIRNALLVVTVLAACGDNDHAPIDYSNPPPGGALRLVKNKDSTSNAVVLDLIVGDQPLTGYAVGFDLPVAAHAVRLTRFTPGAALDPGTEPVAARGLVPVAGPLANTIVTGLSQKAPATDSLLAPKSVLYTFELGIDAGAPSGVVFDGTAEDFVLPSGGLRDHTGATVVEAKDVSIGKLTINR